MLVLYLILELFMRILHSLKDDDEASQLLGSVEEMGSLLGSVGEIGSLLGRSSAVDGSAHFTTPVKTV